jgi:ABC-type nitrate/sulfonate/bicarbonate transport system permease component
MIRDGSLISHVGASLLRVGLGTLIGVVTAVPLGIAMGVDRSGICLQALMQRTIRR